MKQKKVIALLMALVFMLMLPIGTFAKELEAGLTEKPATQIDGTASNSGEGVRETTNQNPTTKEPAEQEVKPAVPAVALAPDNPEVITPDIETPAMDLPSFSLPQDVAVSPETLQAENATDVLKSGDYEYKLVDGGVEITKYIGKNDAETPVTIPDTLENKAIVSMGESAFRASEIPSVVIGNNVKKIGKNAFYDCANLNQVVFSKSVVEIGESAFSLCGSLKRIEIPDTLTTIKKDAFGTYNGTKMYGKSGSAAEVYANESGLVFVALNGQKSGDYYYEDYNDVDQQGIRIVSYEGTAKEITLNTLEGRKVLAVKEAAFSNNKTLEKLTVSDAVKTIEKNAFSYCSALKTLILNEGLQEIESGAFSNTGVESVSIPNSVQSVGGYTFSSCKGLKKVTTGTGITQIPYSFVSSCNMLESVEFKGVINKIESNAFSGCSNLKEITIPESVTEIGFSIFEGCGSIRIFGKTGSYADQYAKANNLVFINENTKRSGEYYYDVVMDGVKLVSYAGTNTTLSLPDVLEGKPVTEIGTSMFRDNKQLEKVVFGKNVKRVGKYAFNWCSKLSNLVLNQGLEEIDTYAFQYAGITELKLPDSLTKLGKDTAPYDFVYSNIFEGCSALKSVEVGVGLKSLPQGTFTGCYMLRKALVPENVQSIAGVNEDGDAFSGCERLVLFGKKGSVAETYSAEKKHLFIDETVKSENGYYYESVGNDVKIIFADNLGQKTVPQSLADRNVVAIGDKAFYGDSSLEVINLKQIKIIGEKAFAYCEKATKLELGNQLENIGNYAFYYCGEITMAKVPNSTKAMGIGAFNYCRKMTSITLGSGIQTIETSTFASTNIKSMALPSSIKTVEQDAFSHSLEELVIPDSAKDVTIKETAFFYPENLKSVYFPAGVTNIDENVFGYNYIPPNLTIYGEPGTAAEAYAKAHNINFSTEVWKLGDVNKDTNINASDSLLTLRHSVKEIELKDSDYARGDVNKDAVVNASDGLQILRYSVKEISSFD